MLTKKILAKRILARHSGATLLLLLSTQQHAIAESLNAASNLSMASAYQLQPGKNESGTAGNKADIYRLKHDIDRDMEATLLTQASARSKKQADSGYQMLAAFPTDSPMYGKLMKQPFHAEIEKASNAVALDPALVHAVIYVESRYQASAVSPKGAIGLMQVMPATAARYGIEDVGQSTRVNITAGTKYLEFLMRKFDNRLDLVLAAYNAGEGAVMKYENQIPPYRETEHYVVAVLSKYYEWHQIAVMKKLPQEPVVIEKLHALPIPKDYLQGTRHNVIKVNSKSRY